MFSTILDDKAASLYTPEQLCGDELPDSSAASSSAPHFTQLMMHIEQCLSLPPSATTELINEKDMSERRRKWTEDLGEFFEQFGTRLELEPGDVLVSPAAIGLKRGLDCAFFVLSGVVVEETGEEGGEVYYPAGSLLNTDCFLQGTAPSAVLLAADHSADSFKRTTPRIGRASTQSRESSPPPVGGGSSAQRKAHDGSDGSGAITMKAGRNGSFHTGHFGGKKRRKSPSKERMSMASPERHDSGSSFRGRQSRESREGSPVPGLAIGDKCIVARLQYDVAIRLMNEQPRFARRFFVALAAGLTELLQMRSVELRSAVRAIGSQASAPAPIPGTTHAHVDAARLHSPRGVPQSLPDFFSRASTTTHPLSPQPSIMSPPPTLSTPRAVADATSPESLHLQHYDRSGDELAAAFSLPEVAISAESSSEDRMLLASCDCFVSIEEHSEYVWTCVRARFYLLGSHICVERDNGPLSIIECLSDRKAIALGDVLGLLDMREGKDEGKKEVKSAFATKQKGKSARAKELAEKGDVTSIQVRSGSVHIALPPKAFDLIVKEIEIARLAATDTSNLSKDQKEEVSKGSGWSLLRASLNVARGRADLATAARAAVAKTRRSFVSSGSGLTPRVDNLVESINAAQPERESFKLQNGAKPLDDDGFAFVATSEEAARRVSVSGIAQLDTRTANTPRQQDQLPAPVGLPPPVAVGPGGGDVASSNASDAATQPEREILTLSDWQRLLTGARYRRYRAGQKIIRSGHRIDGLIQVVNGTLRVEMPQEDRPQALVVGKLTKGDILGEKTLLLGRPPSIEVVCDSEFAMILRLPKDHLAKTFISHPEIAAKFFFLLAMRMSAKLRKLVEQDLNTFETVATGDTHAPKNISAISENPAFFLILHKFVLGSNKFSPTLGPTLNFIQECRSLLDEPDVDNLATTVRALFQQYIVKGASEPLPCLSEKMRSDVTAVINALSNGGSAHAHEPQAWRHLFDVPVAVGMKAVEDEAFKSFLQSRHYQYVLTLKSKELIIPTMEHFRVMQVRSSSHHPSAPTRPQSPLPPCNRPARPARPPCATCQPA